MIKKEALNKRQKDVLKVIIASHIKCAAPIGSGLVSKLLDLSSATIRNVMGELEGMGYISKPHTSAGRIPTTMGYRYYVNNLLNLSTVPSQQKRFIETQYKREMDSIETMLETISHVLSVLTKYAGIACLSNLKFYIEGASNMIDMPEFRDPQRMKMLLRLLDEKTELLKLFNNDLTTEGIKIHIGDEDKHEMLRDLSCITANYRMGDKARGSLGVLGPMRMNYSAMIPLVDFLSRAIESVFDEMEI